MTSLKKSTSTQATKKIRAVDVRERIVELTTLDLRPYCIMGGEAKVSWLSVWILYIGSGSTFSVPVPCLFHV